LRRTNFSFAMKNLLMLVGTLMLTPILNAQIVWTEPAFPTQDDQVTLYYNATQGNGQLTGVIPIYIHTGVISSESASANEWQNVVGNWGTNDAQVIMTPEGNNIHSFNFGGLTLAEFYGIAAGVTIESLAMVFRNVNASFVGRESDGGDIFFALSDGNFSANFSTPSSASVAISESGSLPFIGQASEPCSLSILVNNELVASESNAVSLSYTFTGFESGEYSVRLIADNGSQEIEVTRTIVVLPAIAQTEPLPSGTVDGINYIDDETVVLRLYAPGKDFVFVVGDFNGWTFSLDNLMKRAPDNATYWIEVDGLTPGQEYRFQYHIMPDNMRIADIYAEKILDYWNDPWIPETTYPNLIPFPTEFTGTDAVSVLQTAQEPFEWTDDDYEKPPKERLIIYELLIRDFLESRSIADLKDTLDYLERLGINAIGLMPFNEFEGNDSWGYNPSFFFAPDKYYGTKDMYKAFVNECHSRGMAVIMDIALNHSFGQNPQVRMWFDANAGQWGQPTAENPYFNQTPMHDFNVGYDYDHEAPVTRAFCKRVLEHWVQNYHIDGYRMDLSKGFTQNNTLGNIAAWNAYDQSRINILTDYANHVWSVDPSAYMILEHFADNSEETALANAGFMLWGNLNFAYGEAAMGYSGDFSWGSYQARGWNNPHLVTYAESHDEERLMYKNLNFGNSQGSYNITNLNTALARQEMVHAFLIPIPGPKMMWQFGEVGYDYSINWCLDGSISENCRLTPKPVRWDYPEQPARQRLYRIVAALNHLKLNHDAFSTTNFNLDVGGSGKRIHLNHPQMDVTIVGNFGVEGFSMIPGFQQTGTWYDYFSGEAIEVNDLNQSFFYAPGQYHIYTSIPLETPEIETGLSEIERHNRVPAWPNPFNDQLSIDLSDFSGQQATVRLYDLNGRMVNELFSGTVPYGQTLMTHVGLSGTPHGVYLLEVATPSQRDVQRLVKVN